MNNSSPLTLNDDDGKFDALQKIADIAAEHHIPFFLVGAMARDLLLAKVHDMSKERRTMDVDIGVMVGSWAEFSSFCAALTAKNFERHPRMGQRFLSDKGIIIDIVPFGGLADSEGCISWPPDNDPKMCVTGFEDALRDCLQIKISETLFVNVVSLPGLAMLKILAWSDRNYQSSKDAQDFELLLRLYGDMSNSRLFGPEVALMEKHNFDIDMAGPELLGQDIGSIASDETRLRLVRIMNSHEEEVSLNEILVEQISMYLPGRDYRRAEAILGCVLSGIKFVKEIDAH